MRSSFGKYFIAAHAPIDVIHTLTVEPINPPLVISAKSALSPPLGALVAFHEASKRVNL